MRARLFGHRDHNHKSIADTFDKLGYSVADTSAQGGFVDIVIAKHNITVIVEIKRREKDITITQLEFLSTWTGLCAIVCTEDDARALAADPSSRALTQKQKGWLASFCLRERMQGATSKTSFKTNRILNLLESI